MDLEQRVEKIEERNISVEADKAWETSWTRRLLLAVFIYLAITLYIWYIGVPDPLLSGIVPAVGFMLSTLTMPFFKSLWLKNRK